MATETIDIIVRENGARVVKRNLEEIGAVAERSVRGLRLLQNALFVLGGAGLLAGLTRMLDTLTNFENRLVLVTKSTQELNTVQKELLNISNRTRSSFESTAEIYTRVALAVRELGLSQKDTLNFTETLNQATILSGASSREAGAALLQLSQGLASGRLNGDELRSVLEQLPFVADVIAKQLGVTRGELRKLGSDGKITTDIIINAFRNAREEIAGKFAQTVPTISQAFSVLRTEALRLLDAFDDSTGASEAVARAILALSNSLNVLVGAVIAAIAAFAGWKIGALVSSLASWLAIQHQVTAAVAAGNATLLTATGIEQAKAATALQAAAAESANAAATVRSTQADLLQLQTQRSLLLQQQASIAIDTQRRIARDALTGRFIAHNAAVAQNIKTNIALQRTETALLATKGQLTGALAAQTAATNTLTAAQSRSTVANVAAGGVLARLSTGFPGLAAIVRGVASAFTSLWAVIVANPIGAIIAGIAAVVLALVYFSDQIGVADNGLVTLRDVGIATFQLIMEAIAPVGKFLVDVFGPALNWVGEKFTWLWNKIVEILGWIVNAVKTYINTQIGLWVGLVNSVVKAWDILPAALMDVGKMAINGLITVIETGINGILAAIQGLLNFIGQAAVAIGKENPFANLIGKVDLSQYRQELSGAASEVGQIFSEEFGKSLNTDYIGNAWSAVLARARQVAQERLARTNADLNKPGTVGTTPKAAGTTPGAAGSGNGGGKTFEQIVKELTLQNELLRVNSAEREKLQAIIKVEEELKRKLTETERSLVMEILNENETLKKAAEIYQSVRGPAYEYELTLRALNELLKAGKINQAEFTNEVIKTRIEFLNSQTDMASGMERGFLKILQKTGDYATQMENIITTAFDGMSSAIADLVVDGEADFGSLIRSINKMIIQLVVSQAFQQLFGGSGIGGGVGVGIGGGAGGGLAGGGIGGGIGVGVGGGIGGGQAGGNIFGSLFSGFKSLFGLQTGGSFIVGPNTGIAPLPNGGNDNRLVAFRAQDGEEVSVTPRGQSGRNRGASNQTIVNFNITTPDVASFRASESQLSAKAARMIGRGQRNM
jgi:lambda family phage tail tape measure protein